MRERKINFRFRSATGAIRCCRTPLLQILTSERDRQIAIVASPPTTVGPGYWMAPEVPDATLVIVRRALRQRSRTQRCSLTRALNLEMRPKTGVEMQAAVAKIARFPPTLTQTAAILKW